MSNTVFCNQGLHIQSSHMTANFSNSYSDFLTNGGSVQGDPPNLSFSLTALRSIICQTLVVTSDDRIKDNIRDINDENALVQLRSIQPKIYGYKDKYEKGNIETIGFIAQQIKKVIPQAVALTRRAIPNILTPAFVHVKNDKIELKLRLPLGNDIILKNGCFIQVSIANQNYEFEFLSYSNENESIIVAVGTENINKISEGVKAVIYGEIVDDFHCIDEAQIFTITTAALQEVDRQLTAEKAKTAFLQDQMTDVLSRLALLEKQKKKKNNSLS